MKLAVVFVVVDDDDDDDDDDNDDDDDDDGDDDNDDDDDDEGVRISWLLLRLLLTGWSNLCFTIVKCALKGKH